MKYKKIILASIATFGVLFLYYVLTSNGLGNKPFYLQLRRFIPMSIIFVLMTNYLSTKTKPAFFTSFALVSLTWILTYPVLYKISFGAVVPFFSHHFDIVFGIYSFIALTGLTALALHFNWSKVCIPLLSLLQTALLCLPLLEIGYYCIYGNNITETAILSIYQTNPDEAKEFLLQVVGVGGIIASIGAVLALFILLFVLNSRTLKLEAPLGTAKKGKIVTAIVCIAALVYSFSRALPQTGLLQLNSDVRNYFHAISAFNKEHEATLADLQLTAPQKTFAKPGTIIVVIGESASRNFMSAFSKTENDTTPWLRAQKEHKDFIIFPNAYSSRANTVFSLERALTEKNQYNEKEFRQSATILDIAKKAGYYTSWYSNQGTTDIADTPITVVGRTADTAKWTNEDVNKTRYDGALLDYLKEVDPQKNNFIVLHFMGSHDNYQNRYPVEFAKWGDPSKNEPILNYDNSLYYTDYLLAKIHKYAAEKLNLQAMLYFSDHGAVPNGLRNADSAEFAWLRVPMFLYLSPEYQSTYPETAKILRAHEKQYFTNDLIYDLVCGLLNITSNHYDESQSIASDKYKFTRATLKTNLSKTPLTDDKTDE